MCDKQIKATFILGTVPFNILNSLALDERIRTLASAIVSLCQSLFLVIWIIVAGLMVICLVAFVHVA